MIVVVRSGGGAFTVADGKTKVVAGRVVTGPENLPRRFVSLRIELLEIMRIHLCDTGIRTNLDDPRPPGDTLLLSAPCLL